MTDSGRHRSRRCHWLGRRQVVGELRLLDGLLSGQIRLPDDLGAEAQRLIGGFGTDLETSDDLGFCLFRAALAPVIRAWARATAPVVQPIGGV